MLNTYIIRSILPEDTAVVIGLAVSAGLFAADDTAVLEKMLATYFSGGKDEGHQCLLITTSKPLGVAYYLPKPATDRAWELLMIAVNNDTQSKGYGTILLTHVEETLRANDQRLLLVETSGLPSYERTRKFYLKCGYEQAARVQDYYATGEDMVLFRKLL